MWEQEIAVAEEASRTAGKILDRMFGRVNHIVKKGDIDLVTEADFQAEKIIMEIIHRNYPKDNILSEESGMLKEISKRTWIVDPLDGTTNFAHGFPFFAISIALEFEKQIVLGIVYDPHIDECFQAVKGKGAFLNKIPIKISNTNELGDSLLATGFPYNVREKSERIMGLLTKILVKAQGVRRPGSAALDLCYVASGRFDGFWEQGLKPWDTAAGMVIVNEAGGKVTTYEGEVYSPYKKSIVASNPYIHDAIIRVCKDSDQ